MTSTIPDLLRQSRQLAQSGQLDQAAQQCDRILALEPDNPAAHFELGLIALKRGQQELAIERISRAIQFDPDQSRFHALLGIAYGTLGNLAEGTRCFKRSLELDPDDQHTHNNLGKNYKKLGKLADAERCFRAAIAINPDFINACSNLGDLLSSRGDLAAAVDIYQQALKNNSDLPSVQFPLAQSLFHLHGYQQAMTLLRQVAVSQPAYPGLDNMLGLTLMKLGKFDQASAHYREAMLRQPDSAAPHVNLGDALSVQGDPLGALASFRNALAIEPDHATAHSNLLLILNYLPQSCQEDLYQEALKFDLQHAGALLQSQEPFHNARDHNKVLRIGYLSADFRSHSVAHFIGKLLAAHNRDQVEIFCYANVMRQDAITATFKMHAEHWLSIVGMQDEDVALQIREDRIDILVDLSGHTANNRLLVFARKPAPVQVSWLGYPNTTGMQTMDYRLTDAIADPAGDADRLHTEQLVRLQHGFLCYQTAESIPAVSAPPCLQQGHITFGSFNHLPKITAEVIRVWATILKRVPHSRLILKAGTLADDHTREKFSRIFLEQGIPPTRLDLLGRIRSRKEHLEAYSRIDICLDPFPYNGTTTTCEALWMGVPVISLRGDRHAGRVGASILQHTGLPELVADSEEQYIDLAHKLASDTEKRLALRADLRPQMSRSALMNLPQFTETLENAYREMWLTWCNAKH